MASSTKGIVHFLPDLPEEGSVVFASNGQYSPDRAIFKGGKFFGGGDFPVPSYEMSQVDKWFYLDDYASHIDGNSYMVGFRMAEKMDEGVMLSFNGEIAS